MICAVASTDNALWAVAFDPRKNFSSVRAWRIDINREIY
jgi:hypothetical protein